MPLNIRSQSATRYSHQAGCLSTSHGGLLLSGSSIVHTFTGLESGDDRVAGGQTIACDRAGNVTWDTIRLHSELAFESVPAKWEASICDKSFCGTSLVPSGAMTPVAPSGPGKLFIRLTPHVTTGMATIQYAIWDGETLDVNDTLTCILTALESWTLASA